MDGDAEYIWPKDIRCDGLLKLSALKRIEKARAAHYPNARKPTPPEKD